MIEIPAFLQEFMDKVETLPQVEVTLHELGPYATVRLQAFVQYRIRRLKEVDDDIRRRHLIEDLQHAEVAYRRLLDESDGWIEVDIE